MQPYAKTPNIVSAQLAETAPMNEVTVDIEMPMDELLFGGGLSPDDALSFDETGALILADDEGTLITKSTFSENLAEKLDEEELKKLGTTLCEDVEADLQSRAGHYEKFTKGITALGINFDESARKSDVFGSINHPLLIEAATQFQARAMAELFPPDGPAKTRILGEATQELADQALRVQDYLNYLLVYKDRAYYDECEQKLFVLPFTGSEFDKQYHDSTTGKTVSRWVRFEDFAVQYGETSLETCDRYTHILHESLTKIKKMQDLGKYLKVEFPNENTVEDTELKAKVAEIDGVEVSSCEDNDSDKRDLFESHVIMALPGIDNDDALPYVITVDRDTHKVLAIYRNWKENDPFKNKRMWFTHKKFLPGLGFYGFGLFHTIGSLGETATKIIQILLDAGAFSAVQGGFRTKDAKSGSLIDLEPGVYKEVDASSEELAKSFFTPNFREPSSTLFNLLGALEDLGRRFAATTEVMVGDAATTGPVGTTVALVEQGSKVFSGIHKRLHKSVGDELIHLADLSYDQLDTDSYPYSVGGVEKEVFKEDFDGRVDIIPVSDPNITSNAQRIALAQAVYQIATQMPDISDRREAALSLLKAMRAPELEKIFPPKQEAVRADPVTEIASIAMGRPVRAYLDQDHKAHIAVHMGAMQAQMVLPQMIPVLQAHIAQHMAMDMYVMLQQQMPMQLPPIDWAAEAKAPMSQPLPPQIEAMIAAQSAQAMQQLLMQQAQAAEAQKAQQQAQQGAQGGQPPAQDNALQIAAMNAQTQQQLAQQKAAMKQQELAVKGKIAAEKNALDQNKFMMSTALAREEFEFQRQQDIAEFQQSVQQQQADMRQAIKDMLIEFRNEMAVKNAELSAAASTPKGETK